MKKIYNTLLPKYVRLPLLIVVVMNTFTFSIVPMLLGDNIYRYDFTLTIDSKIPFVPFFIVFYVFAFAQWIFSYIYHCQKGIKTCYRMVGANLVAKFVCLILFIFLPTQMCRPEILDNGFWGQCVSFVYFVDKPINLLPSIHCLESWLCFRTAMLLPDKNKWYTCTQGVLTVLVFASTVLIKQHLFIDIPAGILAAEIGLLFSDRFGLWRFVNRLQTPSARKALSQHIFPAE